MARIAELWRYPVKSMGGERVDAVRLGARGVHADRLWAVRDLEAGMTATARRLPGLLRCIARYATQPDADAGPGAAPDVVVTFPDGEELPGSDPQVHERLSALLDREVRLVALPPADDTSLHRMTPRQQAQSVRGMRADFGVDRDERLPDLARLPTRDLLLLSRYTTPPGTFVDVAPIHVLTTASLAALGAAVGSELDVRRFRPNVLLDDAGEGFVDASWTGHSLRLPDAELHVSVPTVRCVVPSRPQPGLELDRTITRGLTAHTDRFLGVYADVRSPGVVRVGDPCTVGAPGRPSLARRIADGTGTRLSRGVISVLGRVARR